MTLVSIYLSTLYGVLYGFFEAFSVVYVEIRGFKATSCTSSCWRRGHCALSAHFPCEAVPPALLMLFCADGLTYIALGLGFLFACGLLATVGREHFWRPAVSLRLSDIRNTGRYYEKHSKIAISKGLKPQPEARLGLAYFGAILSPISLIIFAWTAPFTREEI